MKGMVGPHSKVIMVLALFEKGLEPPPPKMKINTA